MRKVFLYLIFVSTGLPALAQEQAPAIPAKRLEQIYLSTGLGPAFTLKQEAKPVNINLIGSITWANNPGYLNRFGFSITGFKNKRAPKAEKFTDPLFNNYEYFSPSFSVGKKKKINETLQFQAFAGGSLNLFSEITYISPESAAMGFEGFCFPQIALYPGVLLQAEVLTMPSRFHGFSLGLFYNVSPWFFNGGLNLKVNTGLLQKRNT